MKNKYFLSFFMLLLLTATGCSKQGTETEDQSTSKTPVTKSTDATKSVASNDYPMSSAESVADKLEVYYFHSTARCTSCKTIGRYVQETMEQKYSNEIKEGKIDYREINVEESENFDIARKFKASGSSLKLNKIIGEQDNIEEETAVWRLLGDEVGFKKYLEAKIDSYLGI